jgi:membrane-bound ClpP family serine protease
MKGQRITGNKLVLLALGLFLFIGFVVWLAQALVIPLLIIGFVILVIGIKTGSEEWTYIGVLLILGSFISLIIGFVFGGTEFGKTALWFFNNTVNTVNSYPVPK